MTRLMIGSAMRVAQVRKTFDHLPAWRCISITKGTFYVCGRCFAGLGNGPATNGAEMWTPGTDGKGDFHYEVVPEHSRCEKCGGRAWPRD